MRGASTRSSIPAVLPDSYRATLSAFGRSWANCSVALLLDSHFTTQEALLAPFRLTHMELRDFQDTMREIYLKRDEQRGVDATFRWLTEELGELARAIRTSERTNLELEFSDVSGIRAIVAAAEKARDHHRLILHGLPPLMRRVMDVVGWTELPTLFVAGSEPGHDGQDQIETA